MLQKVELLVSWLGSPKGAVLFAFLWGLDNALAAIPQIKSNNMFQVVTNGLKWLKDKFGPKDQQ